MSFQWTLNLKKGDQLWVGFFGSSSYLHDDSSHLTHFTGFLLEEEIVASLWGSTSSATHDTFYDTNIFV
jgi:predicted choloylglycine hydrolase